ncbi:hypothetical protein [Bordetella bronchiseptica]|uniref:hypothetical protein n=1 Tax=Bordetella bronchiseptica TaxID=518 RepID=UPI001CE33A67|nr:hypothetical protein [Bordetella bronchiseptica]WLS62960.1 hypothetical protein RAK11_19470 [Bordetella bronchiseptica]
MASGNGATKPLWASSNDVLSENGSSFSSAALASRVAASAGFGACADHAGFDRANVDKAKATGARCARNAIVRQWRLVF